MNLKRTFLIREAPSDQIYDEIKKAVKQEIHNFKDHFGDTFTRTVDDPWANDFKHENPEKIVDDAKEDVDHFSVPCLLIGSWFVYLLTPEELEEPKNRSLRRDGSIYPVSGSNKRLIFYPV